jgi:hypothetical protein
LLILTGFILALDLILIALPIPNILALQMPLRNKLGIILIFAAGLFTTFCSVTRIVYIHRFGENTSNPTYTSVPVLTWSAVEEMMSIVVACLPALVQPVSRFIRNRKLDRSHASGANTPGNTGYSNMSGSRSKMLGGSATDPDDKSMGDGIWKTSTTRMEAGSRAGSANTDEMELVERGSKQYGDHKGQHSYVTQWSV